MFSNSWKSLLISFPEGKICTRGLPFNFAIWPTSDPTAPAAAETTTVSPG